MAQGFTGSNALLSGSGAATRVAFWSSANVLSSNAGLTFVAGTQTLTTTNLVVSTAATFSFGTATRIPYYGASGGFTDSANMTFDGNQLALATQGGSGGVLLGGDSLLYRGAADTLRTPDSAIVDGYLVLGSSGVITNLEAGSLWSYNTSWLILGNHATGYAFTRYGVALGGFLEFSVFSNTGVNQGMIIGIHDDKPLIFGQNNLERARFATGGVFTISTSVTLSSGNFITALTDGNTGGLRAGASSDVLWYRSAADTWRTPDALVVDVTVTVGSSVITGTSGNLTIGVTAAKTLTLAAADNYTLTVPATGTAALLATANVFTANQTISNTAPSLALTDTTASAKSLTIAVDANIADFRESAGASGSLLALDLANNRVGIGVAPSTALHLLSASAEFRHAGSATNQTLAHTFYDNNATLEGRLIYAGGNAGGNRYLGILSDAADFLTLFALNNVPIRFYTNSVHRVTVQAGGNFAIGSQATAGTSAAYNILLPNAAATSASAAPTGSITDHCHVFCADAAAGKAWPTFREEGNTTLTQFIMGVNATQGVSSGTGTVKMNGATNRNSVGWITTNDHAGNVIYIPYWTTVTG